MAIVPPVKMTAIRGFGIGQPYRAWQPHVGDRWVAVRWRTLARRVSRRGPMSFRPGVGRYG
jgi:hypothetical protein